MMESPKICPICREPCLSNFSAIFQKGADNINEVSRLKNESFIVRPGMDVHVSCRRNYKRRPGVTSSSAKVSYRKTSTLSGAFDLRKDCFYCGCVITDRQKRKLRNHVMSPVRTEWLIKQSVKLSLTEKMISGPLKLKDAMLV